MNRDITEMVSKCTTCLTYRNANVKEPLISHEVISKPWYKVAVDVLYLKGINYLIFIDYFSKYVEIAKLSNTCADTVIMHCKSIFARHGIPAILMSDNGIFASHAFVQFCNSWDIKQITSSPEYAQSNGLVERSVQSVKKMFKKVFDSDKDPYLSLLEYRNTPLSYSFYSPAQLLMGRRLRGILPMRDKLLNHVKPNYGKVEKFFKANQSRQAHYYNKHAKNLSPLQKNDAVVVRRGKEWVPGVVINFCNRPRSYKVRLSNGTVLERNRKFLIKKHQSKSNVLSYDDYQYDMPVRNNVTFSPNSSGSMSKSPIVRLSPSVSNENRSVSPSTPNESVVRVSPQSPIRSRYGRAIRPPRRLDL
jgi:transposase InsO family protein